MCGEEVGVNKLDVRRDKETARATDDHKTPYSASFDSANNRFAPTDEVIEQFRIVPARIECGDDGIVVSHGICHRLRRVGVASHDNEILLRRNAPVLSNYRRDIMPTAEQRSEEHTSELQSLMRTSYAVF